MKSSVSKPQLVIFNHVASNGGHHSDVHNQSILSLNVAIAETRKKLFNNKIKFLITSTLLWQILVLRFEQWNE